MRRQFYLWSIVFLCGLLAACQPKSDVLPTLIDLDAIATNDAATVTTEANILAATATTGASNLAATLNADSVTQTAVAEAVRPTPLPPTWTASPEATQPPVQNVNVQPSSTPLGGNGTIYFIFNGDSIAALKADGSSEQLILVGGAPAELSLSPDGKLLAYTANGNGSARELFVTSLDGTYVQQVSCLGFARVTAPGWSPDSQTLVFGASQTLNGPLGIYAAGIIGSGQCPTGNNQRLLTQTDLNSMSSVTWNNDGTKVFFTSGAVYGFDMTANLFFPPLTTPTGYGPDMSSAFRPGTDELYYLKSFFDVKTNRTAGTLFNISTASLTSFPIPGNPGTQFGALTIQWSREGRYLLATTERGIYMQDIQIGTATPIITGSNFFPQAVFSPDTEWVAYVDGKPGALTIPEIFIVTKDGQSKRQISTHADGTISNLNWGAE